MNLAVGFLFSGTKQVGGQEVGPIFMTNAAKETKAQRVERLKRSKNPWEGLEEIRRFAREGFDSIPPEWLGTYFRCGAASSPGDPAGVTPGPGARLPARPTYLPPH